jgi:hypothetical protein
VASVGTVTGSSVELLMNANDNSGTIAYTISYSGGTFTIFNPSGNQKSVVIPNLLSNTNYVFTITAADMVGNPVANNPIILNATTTFNPQCSGTSTQSTDGTPFNLGYNYNFQTIGTDVKITFELLDNRVGTVAFLRRQSPFSETQMSNVSGQIFTQTITGQTIGSTINYAVKFAFSGGLSVTRFVSYVVGNDCNSLGLDTNVDAFDFHFQNPVSDFLEITSNYTIDKIELYSIIGNKVYDSTNTNKLEVSSISKGIYLIAVYSGNERRIKKIIIN